jgi:hypothetical protein
MDLSYLGPGETSVEETSFKVPAHEVIDLTSDDESALADPKTVALAEAHNPDLPSDDEVEDETSETLSWLEDILEEVGDEQLFDGGKSHSVATRLLTCIP